MVREKRMDEEKMSLGSFRKSIVVEVYYAFSDYRLYTKNLSIVEESIIQLASLEGFVATILNGLE